MKRDKYFYESALAFIEELQQEGLTYIDKTNKKFVLAEYPHYTTKFTHEMTKIHKWWLQNDERLMPYKTAMIDKVGIEYSNRIMQDKWLRFFILKTFHDSTIADVAFDEEKSTLTMNIDYDDTFCKTPFGKKITLKFYTEEFSPRFINELAIFAKGSSAMIFRIYHEFIGNKSKFNFNYECFSTETLTNNKKWDLEFLCNNVDIASTRQSDLLSEDQTANVKEPNYQWQGAQGFQWWELGVAKNKFTDNERELIIKVNENFIIRAITTKKWYEYFWSEVFINDIFYARCCEHVDEDLYWLLGNLEKLVFIHNTKKDRVKTMSLKMFEKKKNNILTKLNIKAFSLYGEINCHGDVTVTGT